MRTINATLQAALDGGGFNAYIKARVRRLTFDQTYDVLSYSLTGTTLQIKMEGQMPVGDPVSPATIELLRGATINGVNYTVSTSKFIVTSGYNQIIAGITYHTANVQAHLINPVYMDFAADGTYQDVISSFCTALGKTYTLKSPAAAHWAYQFLPTGQRFTSNNAQNFLALLRQKYFIFATDNGAEDILFYTGMATPNEDYTITPVSFVYVEAGFKPKRRFFAKDQNGVIRYTGTEGDSLQNLGYMHSSASLPIRYEQEQHIQPYPIAPQLYLQNGDSIAFDEIAIYPAKITEIFNPSLSSIPWRIEIEQERLFSSGGGLLIPENAMLADSGRYPLPENPRRPGGDHRFSTDGNSAGIFVETVEEIVSYAPLHTGAFTGALSATDSHIQAAFETLDEHTHTATDIGVREKLTAARTYYVRTDGSNGNTGLVDSAGGAFLTIQKAVDTIAGLDINGQTITVQVKDGTYTGAVTLKNVVGFSEAGNLVIQGNNGTPANVVISTTSADAFLKNGSGSIWDIKDLKITTTTAGNALNAVNGGTIRFGNLNFGAVPNPASAHIKVSTNGNIEAIGNYAVSGGGYIHMWSDSAGVINVAGRTITFSNSPAFAYFAVFETVSFIFAYSMTFTNGGTVTGQRYLGTLNGATQTNGGATYFPGNVAGATGTGAQYG